MQRRSKPLNFIQRGAPWSCDEGDDASVLLDKQLLEKPCRIAMNKLNPMLKYREAAVRELEDPDVRLEGDTF